MNVLINIYPSNIFLIVCYQNCQAVFGHCEHLCVKWDLVVIFCRMFQF